MLAQLLKRFQTLNLIYLALDGVYPILMSPLRSVVSYATVSPLPSSTFIGELDFKVAGKFYSPTKINLARKTKVGLGGLFSVALSLRFQKC